MKFLAVIYAIAAVMFFGFKAAAMRSGEFHLVGKIVSFDEKTISLKSGNTIYTLQKSSLNFPSYKVGDEIEVATTDEAVKHLASKPASH